MTDRRLSQVTFCSNCGAENHIRAPQCSKCGRRLTPQRPRSKEAWPTDQDIASTRQMRANAYQAPGGAAIPWRSPSWTVPALLALLVVLQAISTFRGPPQPAYEYRVEHPSDTAFSSQMNAWGDEGWELVSARRAASGDGYDRTVRYEVILMRAR